MNIVIARNSFEDYLKACNYGVSYPTEITVLLNCGIFEFDDVNHRKFVESHMPKYLSSHRPKYLSRLQENTLTRFFSQAKINKERDG